KEIFNKYNSDFNELGINPNLGLANIFSKIEQLPKEKQNEIRQAFEDTFKEQADLAMVDSDKGITNLHAPNLIIIDASMPPLIRDGGKMWSPEGKLKDAKAIIPDRTYARFYQIILEYIKENGAFDVSKMGNVSNVGLMAQKAEEYGSHDKTFEAHGKGTISAVDADGNILFEHNVEKGDIYRSCQTKDIAVKDWVKLAVNRATETKNPAIFWLDKNRAHDAQIISKVEMYLKDFDTKDIEIYIMTPEDAMNFTLKRVKDGLDTISVTGNALRDYLTDLFPILELGTSAKMLSIVPLLEGGGLFETGAGGSAPKHIEQFIKEGHLRWDSLGEFLALTVSFEKLGKYADNKKASILGKTLDNAVSKFLQEEKSPSRVVNELDNRGSHFYLAMFWAQELASNTEDSELKQIFEPIAKQLADNESTIIEELNNSQGVKVDIGGYFLFDKSKADDAMRPSKTLNSIIESI
ncbi:MAG: NADP-dependent isocitrate dehydrogenase, partial [Bacteroidota bacterium]|nr:NADP-dependent isocitrate dehydrogenase [Bacteroidota bacterium]